MNGLPRVAIFNFVKVMNWFNGFRFMIKQLSPFFLGFKKGYVSNPLPTSIVPLDSIDLTSEAIMLSQDFGTFASHLWVGLPRGGFQLSCNKWPCIVPNMKGSWLIPIHSFAIKILLLYGLGKRAFGSQYGLGCPSSGSSSLLTEWCFIPKKPTSG